MAPAIENEKFDKVILWCLPWDSWMAPIQFPPCINSFFRMSFLPQNRVAFFSDPDGVKMYWSWLQLEWIRTRDPRICGAVIYWYHKKDVLKLSLFAFFVNVWFIFRQVSCFERFSISLKTIVRGRGSDHLSQETSCKLDRLQTDTRGQLEREKKKYDCHATS